MDKINPENKDDHITNRNGLYKPVRPDQKYREKMNQFHSPGQIEPKRTKPYGIEVKTTKIIDITTENRYHTVHQ
jgi:hypothetical protein